MRTWFYAKVGSTRIARLHGHPEHGSEAAHHQEIARRRWHVSYVAVRHAHVVIRKSLWVLNQSRAAENVLECNTQNSKFIFMLGIHVHVYFSSNKWKGFVLDPYDVKLSFLVKRNSNCTKRTHNQPFWVKRDDLCNFCKKSNRGPEKSTGWPKSQNWLKWSKTPGLNFKIAVRAKLS